MSASRIVTAYKNSDAELDMCISVYLKNTASTEVSVKNYCSPNKSIDMLIDDTTLDYLVSGKQEINVNGKSVGYISYFISSDSTVSQMYSIIVFLLGSLVETAILVFMWRNATNWKSNSPENADNDDTFRDNINNINKIIEKNKKFFPINNNIVVARYEHPYTQVQYTNGRTNKFRCSLYEMENSFTLPLMRLNGSVLINKSALIENMNTIREEGGRHWITVTCGGESIQIEVGQKYLTTVLNVNKELAETD